MNLMTDTSEGNLSERNSQFYRSIANKLCNVFWYLYMNIYED